MGLKAGGAFKVVVRHGSNTFMLNVVAKVVVGTSTRAAVSVTV